MFPSSRVSWLEITIDAFVTLPFFLLLSKCVDSLQTYFYVWEEIVYIDLYPLTCLAWETLAGTFTPLVSFQNY